MGSLSGYLIAPGHPVSPRDKDSGLQLIETAVPYLTPTSLCSSCVCHLNLSAATVGYTLRFLRSFLLLSHMLHLTLAFLASVNNLSTKDLMGAVI